MRKQFTFYRSYWEAIRRLKREKDRLSALEAIISYALDEELPETTDVADGIFILIKPTLDSGKRKAENGRTGGKAEANGKQTASKAEANGKQTASEKEREGEGEKEKEKESECYRRAHAREASRFVPPSVSEVEVYCRERGNGVDAQAFVDFYESKGWKIGRDPMKDWKAAVRTWEKREEGRNATAGGDQKPASRFNFTGIPLD